jgi:para-nitrobenzyl esterase
MYLKFALLVAAASAASLTPESAPHRAELARRAAAGAALGHSPRRVLAEFLADAALAKARTLRAHAAAGHLGTVLVNTSYGPLSGIGGGNATVNQFLGVPFAAPPTGALRWRAPAPPTPWGPAPRDATWFAPTCMQEEWYWGALTGLSEDCLYADVYVPAAVPPPGGYPVMLFWYGGSWTYGGASFPLYDGETDVALMKDVILVAANYRLNVFGYLAGDELLAESADKSVGNYGFQDQRAAMRWVRDEIAHFGGDPAQVTIFGESAGGGSVSNHLVSPRSRGLFARAAIQSGSFASWTAQPYNISRTRLPQVARNLGCAGSTGPALLTCLRAVNETSLLAADRGLTEAFLEWGPVIDGVEVVDDPRALAAAGALAPVPVLMGFNADEGTLFNDAPTDLNASLYEAAIASTS